MNEDALLSVPVWTKPGLPKDRILHIPWGLCPVNGLEPPYGYEWAYVLRCKTCGVSKWYRPNDKWEPVCYHAAKPYELGHLEDHWILM